MKSMLKISLRRIGPRLGVVLLGFATGCQSTHQPIAKPTAAEPPSSVAHDGIHRLTIGAVDVFTPKVKLLSNDNSAAKRQLQLAGYEGRNVSGIITLRHKTGITASVTSFVQPTNETIGVGQLQYRKSGDNRVLVTVDGQLAGECTARKAKFNIRKVTLSRPFPNQEGERVVIGTVQVGDKHIEVTAQFEYMSEQKPVSDFFNGRTKLISHEYSNNGDVLARRTRSPGDTVEFSRQLTPTEQLCIAADMYFHIARERASEAAANTIYIPVIR